MLLKSDDLITATPDEKVFCMGEYVKKRDLESWVNTVKRTPLPRYRSGNYTLVQDVGRNDCCLLLTDHNDRVIPEYQLWAGVLQRTHSETYKRKNPTYYNATMSDDWLSLCQFYDDIHTMEHGYKYGLHLDKDILSRDDKHYSKETCLFVTPAINQAVKHAGASDVRYHTPSGFDFHRRGSTAYIQKRVAYYVKYWSEVFVRYSNDKVYPYLIDYALWGLRRDINRMLESYEIIDVTVRYQGTEVTAAKPYCYARSAHLWTHPNKSIAEETHFDLYCGSVELPDALTLEPTNTELSQPDIIVDMIMSRLKQPRRCVTIDIPDLI
jgi:hypothetical protein